MARLRSGRHHFDPASLFDCRLSLLIGPVQGGPSDGELRLAWDLVGDELMEDDRGRVGTRPWGFWAFEVGEERPAGGCAAETVRLAELGVLRPDELAALGERASEARLRVGTPRERISGGNRQSGVSVDAAAVELWAAVQETIPR